MRQILYMSSSTISGDKADLVGILEQSRHNNAFNGITGLLWSDGTHFLQVIEGPTVSIDATFGRIVNDDRHHDLSLQHNLPIHERQFGAWTMAHRRADDPVDAYDARMRRLLNGASQRVRDPFLALMATGSLDG
ncbi:BLUF domain-containing protein [Sphingomonas sp. OK281]|uniref:BLUF domain-containing protein n=1 Tax=Sphingomonas sp. OK281 TaxID=1881067 RepID=UPI0008E6681C|nr:BLUF domain-containing protein [Sphingomonas sp. OK281]SFO27146.1 Sensors of blue-light using FAD [Sphingomonas sp. OK281]